MNAMVKMTCIYCLAICFSMLLQINLVTAEPYKQWRELTPLQQEALKPLAVQWNSLPTKLQKNLLNTTKHYPKLTLDQKQRFQGRLENWSKLTPEQRERARNKYKVISKLPPEKREQIEQKDREPEYIKANASSVPASKAVD
jgi:hypothetical protein